VVQGPVVVGVDGSPTSQEALAWGLETAAGHGVPLEAVCAWEWVPPLLDVVLPDERAALAAAAEGTARSVLDTCLSRRPADAPPVQATARAVEGDPRTVLLAASSTASLLVVGRHGVSALRRRLLGPALGSVAGACLTRSPAPVAVLSPEQDGERSSAPPARVVVGVDGSDASVGALRWAADHAAAVGAPLVAVLAWQLTTLPAPQAPRADWSVPPISEWEDEARRLLDATVETLGSDRAAAVTRVPLHRPAAAGLLETVGPDDLLVLGERGRGGFARLLLGSVSRQCAEHAPCPVVVVPGPDGHRLPATAETS